MSLNTHKNSGCGFESSIGALSFKLPWCVSKNLTPNSSLRSPKMVFFLLISNSSLLTYGVILALILHPMIKIEQKNSKWACVGHVVGTIWSIGHDATPTRHKKVGLVATRHHHDHIATSKNEWSRRDYTAQNHSEN